ncbi:M14-type cytosolic carboxypeptidase [Paraferrimonas sp. SM1919]|uniref:M14 family metallopeptidase n=1 Tax=Paraferrimonas sp. SM1919 TaxID=2662263 RepID=UPI0013D04493|nr:M14-type cytosolic carboxypeptidase [Paraferrimonas sp. SM1919]
MRINHFFDGANIDVVAIEDPQNIQLKIKPDVGNEFFQWFNFRFEGQVGKSYKLNIINAGEASYVEGWDNYQAVASYDRNHWFRLPTVYENGELKINLELECDSIQIAYFAPYSYERHLDLIAEAQTHPLVSQEFLGHTLDGRDMTLLKIGDGDESKKNLWVIARQHPGETMAQWWVEGFLNSLLDHNDANGRSLLAKANIYLVANMNPDGSVRGHLRTNAAGINLNREWLEPSMEKSPEVFLVRQKMLETGVDCFLDVHGDEAIPYNFLAGPEGVPRYDSIMAERQKGFSDALLAASSDFQTAYGYDVDDPGQANLTVATNWVAQQFGCLANTLEMPFKDNDNMPDFVSGWSPERSALLGRSCLIALNNMMAKC